MSLRMIRSALASLVLVAGASCIAMSPALADDGWIGINTGVGSVVTGERSAVLGVQYVGEPLIWKVHPHAGAYVTHRGGVYGYAGFGIEFRIAPQIIIRGNTAVGAYGQGDDIDLGHVLEFRSGLEFVVEFDDKSQLGFGFHHLSNAGIGERNPGTEVGTISYSVPLDRLF